MKGEITLKVLETIKDFVGEQADLFEAFLNAGYGVSAGKMRYEFDQVQKRKRQDLELRKIRRRYSNFISGLRSDGLIEKESFNLTEKGRRKLKALKESCSHKLPNTGAYSKTEGDKYVIVIFDIPEKYKKKRVWLRSALKKLGLELVQKSVWIGRVKIPKDFIDNLAELKLIEYVEIFEISKSGTLKSLKSKNNF